MEINLFHIFHLHPFCGFFIFCYRIIPENVDVLTEIGILYLKVNDTKSAFDKLFQATNLDGNCTKAIMALGAILQVSLDFKYFWMGQDETG